MKILIIEDEKELATSIIKYLEGYDYRCEYCGNLAEAQDKISLYDYDCILLDLMLPDGSGFELLEEIKRQGKNDGVIIISAKDGLATRLSGLELGADDFLVKPFHLSELLARIHALIRRKNFNGSNILIYNEIRIDTLAKTVKIKDDLLDVTKKELDLLLYLISNKNRVVSKSSIAEHLSGDMADMMDNHDFIYAHIKNLKRKLSEKRCTDYIKTVYGLGYKWQ